VNYEVDIRPLVLDADRGSPHLSAKVFQRKINLMSADSQSRRAAAIKAFQDREVQAAQRQADEDRQRRERAERQQAALNTWRFTTVKTIVDAVTKVGNDFANQRSPLLLIYVPSAARAVTFEVRRSGQLNRLSSLVFELDDRGLVHAVTDARGADLPAPVSVSEVTYDWAEQAAEQLMVFELDGRRIPIPDD
jgi:hypothetical protein